MRQACSLLAFFVCWTTAGFALFSSESGAPDNSNRTPERIVSLAPNITEILFALGLEEQLVGVTLDCDYPPETVMKTRVGTFWQPDIEATIALRPQLTITLSFDRQRDIAARLGRMDYNCLSVNIESITDFFAATLQIGCSTAKLAPANELVNDIQTELHEIAARVAGQERLKVLWVVQREPLRVAGRDTFANEIIELAGGENAIGPTLHQYPPIGSEQVFACGAQVIIEPAMGSASLAEQYKSAIEYWNSFESLPAVVNGRVFLIDADTVTRLGPRLARGVRTVAQCLWPDLFES